VPDPAAAGPLGTGVDRLVGRPFRDPDAKIRSMELLRRAVEEDPRLGYAVVFGSCARGEANAGSDLDVAVGASGGRRLTSLELGEIASKLEAAVGRPIDIVDLESAPPALAYRVFRDGRVVLERDRARLVGRRARAILEYLDFKPVEEQFVRGVLAAPARGR
jgi:predicted nucleotidyltransferase